MVYFFLSKFKFRRLIWFNPTSVAPISLKTHHVKFFPLRSSSIFNNQPLKKPLLLQPLRASFRFFRGCNFCPATRWISLTIAKTFTPRVERKSQKSREKPFYHRCCRWPVARQTNDERGVLRTIPTKNRFLDLDIVSPDDRIVNERDG